MKDSKDTKLFHEELFDVEDELMEFILTLAEREAFLAFCEEKGIK